jgi:hypothetical protein
LEKAIVHPKNINRRVVIFILLLLCFSLGAYHQIWAQDSQIKIIDSNGLTRAVRILRSKATVQVTIRSNLPEQSVTLEAVDQALASINGVREDDQIFFKQVASGIWRISLSSGDLLKVQIVDEDN